ncbi:MAG: MarR family transcriptional regulator [Clostridia bacterium]|nr:MarR family transcriptional regulator [Clostridia bacterium]
MQENNARRKKEVTPLMVINEISRLFERAIRSRDNPGSLLSQHSARLILIILAHNDGLTQLEIAQMTHLKPPTVSVTLGKMESLGYVRREADTKDMRAIKVFITDKGRAEHDSKLSQIKEIDRMAIEGLSEDELAGLMGILIKIRNNFTEHGVYDDRSPHGCRKESEDL